MNNNNNYPSQTSTSSKRLRWRLVFFVLFISLITAFILSISLGSVNIPLRNVFEILFRNSSDRETWKSIIINFRLPKALTAVMAGAALSVSGLQMQTLFRNPLADPYVLGISSGASLGVAIAVLSSGLVGTNLLLANVPFLQGLGVVAAASSGALVVFGIVMLVSKKIQHMVTLLVLGLMIGYTTGAVVNILVYFSIPEKLQAFINWTFGSFGGVTWEQMRVLFPVFTLGLLIVQLNIKALNALLLGENYAKSMGLNINMARMSIIGSTSLLAGAITAFCGPIGFLGVAVPHLARSLLNTSDHRILLPSTTLLGAILALLFDLIAQMPGNTFTLPLNAVTALVGAPIIIWVIMGKRNNKIKITT